MKTITAECASCRPILYVEDDEDSREMLVMLLQDAGYAVSAAASIADALSLAKRQRFDLYILDNRFADGSGVDLCRQLRALEPTTPIIFYSGAGYPSDVAAGLAVGAQRYLIKPMAIYTITQTIAEVLTESKQALADVQREPAPMKKPKPANLFL